MSRRGMVNLATALVACAALACVAQGCAVGRAVSGAPATRARVPGAALLDRRCSGCHEVPNPATMGGEAWRASLARMKKRMRLPAAEWDSLAVLASGDAGR